MVGPIEEREAIKEWVHSTKATAYFYWAAYNDSRNSSSRRHVGGRL